MSLVLSVLIFGCASVPPQIAQTHQKELEIIQSLEKSHKAMVDAYVDQKIMNFESFYFDTYGQAYLKNWKRIFKEVKGRDYNENQDFKILYNDLVAEYLEDVAPIEDVRQELHNAIAREYRHAIEAHRAVGRWINSLERLNETNKEAINNLLGSIKPGLSLDLIDEALKNAKRKVEEKIAELSG
jgi:hypothetical protein